MQQSTIDYKETCTGRLGANRIRQPETTATQTVSHRLKA